MTTRIFTALILLFSLLPLSGRAQLSLSLKPGELESQLAQTQPTQLSLRGYIDARDLRFLSDSQRQIEYLDLSNCEIFAYQSDSYLFGTERTFAANEIPAGCFAGFAALKTVYLPKTTVKIGDGAFCQCEQLTSVAFPSSTFTIGDFAFLGCSRLECTFPGSISEIGAYAFDGCDRLTVADLSAHPLKAIGQNAFSNCKQLTEVILPGSLQQIGKSCFAQCENLLRANLKQTSIPRLPDECFAQCRNLSDIQLPWTVRNIGDGAFYYCESLRSIYIPSTVRKIGDFALSGCKALTSIQFFNGTKEIGRWQFYGTSLTQAMLPPSIVFIDDNAFAGCSGLDEIYSEAYPPELGADVFDGVAQNECTLYVLHEMLESYRATDIWNRFKIMEFASVETPTDDRRLNLFFTGDILNIESSDIIGQLTIYNYQGIVLYNDAPAGKTCSIDTSFFLERDYIVSAILHDGSLHNIKVRRH